MRSARRPCSEVRKQVDKHIAHSGHNARAELPGLGQQRHELANDLCEERVACATRSASRLTSLSLTADTTRAELPGLEQPRHELGDGLRDLREEHVARATRSVSRLTSPSLTAGTTRARSSQRRNSHSMTSPMIHAIRAESASPARSGTARSTRGKAGRVLKSFHSLLPRYVDTCCSHSLL
jgi:hypothetical protein